MRFEGAEKKVSAMRAKPKTKKKTPMRSKRATVYSTRYAGRLHFRSAAIPLAVKKRNTKGAISRAAVP